MTVHAPFALPSSQLPTAGVPLGPKPRPAAIPLDWPVGMVGIWPFPIANLPDNFMELLGQALRADDYPELAARAGVAPGGTITLINFGRRIPIGVHAATAAVDAPGDTTGSWDHAHTGGAVSITSGAPGGSPATVVVQAGTGVTVAANAHVHAVTGSSGTTGGANPPVCAVYFVIRVA